MITRSLFYRSNGSRCNAPPLLLLLLMMMTMMMLVDEEVGLSGRGCVNVR